jgi:D-glycero-alpha-D-manno-heptose 1-phosphate guanylyltransferase
LLKEAIILAGGFGTRLQSVVNDVPKPMAPINQLPFLDYIFSYLKFYGIDHVVLSTGYLSEKIVNYYGNQFQGIKISYTTEVDPLGTGGGIRLSMEKCLEENVLVLNGDSFFDVNLYTYGKLHADKLSDCSLALRKVENAARYGTIEYGLGNKVIAFKEKDEQNKPGLINGGVYILNRKVFLDMTESGKPFSIEKDFYEKRLSELMIYGYEYEGYFIDIGIPEDFKKAQLDFKNFKYKLS